MIGARDSPTVGAVALAPLFAFRRLRRLNIPSTLRVME
jgi:hypothetical protein